MAKDNFDAGDTVTAGIGMKVFQNLKKAGQTGSKLALKAAAKGAARIAGPTVILDDMLSPAEANDFDDVSAIKNYKKAEPAAYKDGGVVKKTGVALVHKGERVLTPQEAKALQLSNKTKFVEMRRKHLQNKLSAAKDPAERRRLKKLLDDM